MAPYNKGDVIMRCEPFAIAAPDDGTQSYCHTCLRASDPQVVSEQSIHVKRCSTCRQVAYCSKECQARDWRLAHRDECRHSVQLAATQPTFTHKMNAGVRHIARCLLRVARARHLRKKGDDPAEVEIVDRFLKLDSHVGEFYRRGWRNEQFSQIAQTLRAYLAGNKYVERFSDDEMFEINCRLRYHCRKIVEKGGPILCVEVGELEHACDANASAVFREDGFVHVVATRSIEKDADIRISYVNDRDPTMIRTMHLDFYYFRKCSCAFCAKSDERDADGLTRDDYLRSVRCARALDEDDFRACNAPCPMTKEIRPAVPVCANGHSQAYYESAAGKKRLLTYRAALDMYQSVFGLPKIVHERLPASVISAIGGDIASACRVMLPLLHPINSHALGSFNTAKLQSNYGSSNALGGVVLFGSMSTYLAGNLGQLVDIFERHLMFDGFRLYQELLRLLEYAFIHPIDDEQCAAMSGIHSQLVPLAELFLGVGSRRAVALRQASSMTPEDIRRATAYAATKLP